MTTVVTTSGITFDDASNLTTALPMSYTGFAAYSASGSFTVPAGIKSITVIAGGGAGGAGRSVSVPAPPGSPDTATGSTYLGGSGGFARKTLAFRTPVTPGQVIAFTIGAGGAGSDNTNGSAGGATRFPSAGNFPGNGGFILSNGGGGGTAAATGTPGTNGANGTLTATIPGALEMIDATWAQWIEPIYFYPPNTNTATYATYLTTLKNAADNNSYGNGGTSTAPAWSVTLTKRPGAYGSSLYAAGAGGVGGAVIILY